MFRSTWPRSRARWPAANLIGSNGKNYTVQQEFDNATSNCIFARCGVLTANESITTGQSLSSCDGRFILWMQGTGT